MIEKAMKECHIAVKPNKNSKQQALETIGKLKETLPIERAQMRMKVSTPVRFNNKIRKQLGKLGAACTVESEEKVEENMVLVLLVEPGTRLFSPSRARTKSELTLILSGQYRIIDDLVRNETQVIRNCY